MVPGNVTEFKTIPDRIPRTLPNLPAFEEFNTIHTTGGTYWTLQELHQGHDEAVANSVRRSGTGTCITKSEQTFRVTYAHSFTEELEKEWISD
jgi:hypothetical protein